MCTPGASCNGAFLIYGMYQLLLNGAPLDSAHPYTGSDAYTKETTCPICNSEDKKKLKTDPKLYYGQDVSPSTMLEYISIAPVTAGILGSAAGFSDYKTGIFSC